MKLDELHSSLADFFCQHGLQAMASWPDGRRLDSDEPVILVSLEKLNCASAGLQDYLGQQTDPQTGQSLDLYGRRAQLSFTLDILAAPETGSQACRAVFDRLIFTLQTHKPAGLSVREMSGEELEYDEKERLLRLRCRLECSGWLCTAGDEAGTFLDFTLRGDVNT